LIVDKTARSFPMPGASVFQREPRSLPPARGFSTVLVVQESASERAGRALSALAGMTLALLAFALSHVR
jgi:hypothetical protein